MSETHNWDVDNNSGGNKKFDDEDEDDDIKDNWDDSESEEVPKDDTQTKTMPLKEKKLTKLQQKIKEKEEEERKKREEANKPKTPQEIIEEKLRIQKLVEESDLSLAEEAFGAGNSGSGLSVSLNTKEDWDSFRKSLVDKLSIYEASPHYVHFLENLFRELCVSVESDDIKKLSASLTALYNEKLKAQKAVTKGKKKGKGPSVKVETNPTDAYGDEYDDFDDFM
ncbi:eukaryotic translation initiation factor 3 subunit J-A-like isoform X2 [Oppia nitens]|uniref:eukaryotic translation initiation factor 3 subunit J-A-like isoform X2 n=1 Tax=Oppia nitens TaxID=1686743 RepID=UPI0023DCBB4E|nr:eukaryotic translation initiation factor 3 subunit J-A-like isoform X2 [Oppia nitens]